MDAARIATLLEPFLLYPLAAAQLEHISTYIDLLLRWNARTNLTSIRNPEEIVTRHFGESLFAAQSLFPQDRKPNGREDHGDEREVKSEDAARQEEFPGPKGTAENSPALQRRGENALSPRPIDPALSLSKGTPEPPPKPERPLQLQSHARPIDLLDLGSGAGFPGIPIHLWAPNLHTTLIESQQKKVAFLREVIRSLTLTNINVSPARAEDFPSAARLVTLRAVERFDQILPTAARLVASQSRLALLIATPQEPKARQALPSFTWRPAVPIPLSETRILLVGASS